MWSKRPTCYFCNSKLRWKDIQLADGCYVPACGDCHARVMNGRKLAEARGHYDTNKVRGGDRMKIPRGKTGGKNLKVKTVQEMKLTTLKILDEGEMVTYEPQKEGDKASTKLVLGVSYEGQTNDDAQKWAMNDTTRNICIDLWGDDTATWVNKEPDITISGEGDFKYITIDVLRTK